MKNIFYFLIILIVFISCSSEKTNVSTPPVIQVGSFLSIPSIEEKDRVFLTIDLTSYCEFFVDQGFYDEYTILENYKNKIVVKKTFTSCKDTSFFIDIYGSTVIKEFSCKRNSPDEFIDEGLLTIEFINENDSLKIKKSSANISQRISVVKANQFPIDYLQAVYDHYTLFSMYLNKLEQNQFETDPPTKAPKLPEFTLEEFKANELKLAKGNSDFNYSLKRLQSQKTLIEEAIVGNSSKIELLKEHIEMVENKYDSVSPYFVDDNYDYWLVKVGKRYAGNLDSVSYKIHISYDDKIDFFETITKCKELNSKSSKLISDFFSQFQKKEFSKIRDSFNKTTANNQLELSERGFNKISDFLANKSIKDFSYKVELTTKEGKPLIYIQCINDTHFFEFGFIKVNGKYELYRVEFSKIGKSGNFLNRKGA